MSSSPAHGSFQDILASAKPKLRPVSTSLRELILSLDKTAFEVAWPNHKIASYGVGPKKITKHTYIAVQGSHINLGFYDGVALPDPEDLMEGSGKALRHIKLRSVDAAAASAVAELLRQAISKRTRYLNTDWSGRALRQVRFR